MKQQQTTVEWLVEKLEQNKFVTKSQIYIAKEMEKQQQDDFAIGFAEFVVYLRNFDKEIFHINSYKGLLEIYKKENQK